MHGLTTLANENIEMEDLVTDDSVTDDSFKALGLDFSKSARSLRDRLNNEGSAGIVSNRVVKKKQQVLTKN